MKVDTKKLMGPKWKPRRYGMLKFAGTSALCLMGFGVFTVSQSMSNTDSASADALYSEINPSFTVQHVADVTCPAITESDGKIKVLGSTSSGFIKMDGSEFEETASTSTLYGDYKTNWEETRSLSDASFLNGPEGQQADGYILKEVWVGMTKESDNRSDFTVIPIPETDGSADLSNVSLTNNQNHPDISEIENGEYQPNKDGNYVVCVKDGSILRLMFEAKAVESSLPADIFDYDVTDGSYYLNADIKNKGEKRPSSQAVNASENLYVDADKKGIHSEANYEKDLKQSENTAKLGFGGSSIGFGEETLSNELDTINIWNYAKQEETFETGVSPGMTKGLDKDGGLLWADNISAPDLFGKTQAEGKTAYRNGECVFQFRGSGFTQALASAEFKENDAVTTDRFWIMDQSPSSNADGHDIMLGSGNEMYYTADADPEPFPVSEDGKEHNVFFGFRYTKDFTLSAGYEGPLNFFGCSDDDIWAYAAKTDEDGNIIPESAVCVCDLGGVHDTVSYYTNMWDKIEKVPYGSENENWRLFVFWLERDGTSAECLFSHTLPEPAMKEENELHSLSLQPMESGNTQTGRTFVFDDGTQDKYHGTFSDGSDLTFISGDEFTIPAGMTATIDGMKSGTDFSVAEMGKARVWASRGDGYEETNVLKGTSGKDAGFYFFSADSPGQVSIGAEAENAPDGGYVVEVELLDSDAENVLAIDPWGNPKAAETNREGKILLSLSAGETVSLCNLTENASFTALPKDSPGWRVAEIIIDGAVDVSGRTVSGHADASVLYRYEKSDDSKIEISMEQSASGDWSSSDIEVKLGTPVSYRIMVKNNDTKAAELTVEDILPDGLSVIESTLDGEWKGTLENGVLTWNIKLAAGASAELLFTATVTEDVKRIENTVSVISDKKTITESNSVAAALK